MDDVVAVDGAVQELGFGGGEPCGTQRGRRNDHDDRKKQQESQDLWRIGESSRHGAPRSGDQRAV